MRMRIQSDGWADGGSDAGGGGGSEGRGRRELRMGTHSTLFPEGVNHRSGAAGGGFRLNALAAAEHVETRKTMR